MGSPREAYSSGVLVTMRRSSVTARTTSATRSMIRRPPSSISALGWPPMRVLLPPAWMTPVTLTRDPSYYYRPPAQDARRPDRAVGDGGARAPRGRPAVEDQVHHVIEVTAHGQRCRRRLGAAGIGAGRGHRAPRGADQ